MFSITQLTAVSAVSAKGNKAPPWKMARSVGRTIKRENLLAEPASKKLSLGALLQDDIELAYVFHSPENCTC